MWINDRWKMSEFAFRTILDDKTQDTEEMRAMIEEPIWIYVYCKFIGFNQKMRDLVSNEDWEEIRTERDPYMEIIKVKDEEGNDLWCVVGVPDHDEYNFSAGWQIDNYIQDSLIRHMSNEMAKKIDEEIVSSILKTNFSLHFSNLPNKNGRIYSEDVLKSAIKKLKESEDNVDK